MNNNMGSEIYQQLPGEASSEPGSHTQEVIHREPLEGANKRNNTPHKWLSL
jgi:hypothetical protein